jgi:uncharacterized membrane protein
MKKQYIKNLLVIALAISPLVYLYFSWQAIPEKFVTKFEFSQAIEKIQSRNSLLIATIVQSVLSILIYLLMRNLKRIDPKVNEATPKSSFNKLGLSITIFLIILNFFIIQTAISGWVINANMGSGFFGALIILIGNYMNNLKPNFIAGIRLPWTLNDPENWRKTHQLAGKLWFAAGILLVVISFLLPKSILIPTMISLLVLIVIIPSFYSYRIYRNKLN